MTLLIFNENPAWIAQYDMAAHTFSAHIGECAVPADCTYDAIIGDFANPLGQWPFHSMVLTGDHGARLDYWPQERSWTTTYNVRDTVDFRAGNYQEYIAEIQVASLIAPPMGTVPEASAALLLAMGLVALWNRLGNKRNQFLH